MIYIEVTRDIDGYVIEYVEAVGRRGLVDFMRIEQLKPGIVLGTRRVEAAEA